MKKEALIQSITALYTNLKSSLNKIAGHAKEKKELLTQSIIALYANRKSYLNKVIGFAKQKKELLTQSITALYANCKSYLSKVAGHAKEKKELLTQSIIALYANRKSYLNKVIGFAKQKKAFLISALIALLLIVLINIPVVKAEIHWLWVDHKDELSGYREYVATWPEGRHLEEAQTRYDEYSWQEALSIGTVGAFQQYMDTHSSGIYLAEAEIQIDAIHWVWARTSNTITAYQVYLEQHPDGLYKAEALFWIDELRWEEALSANSVAGYKKYLKHQSQGRYREVAQFNIAVVSNTIKNYLEYIDHYPDGKYAAKAEQKADELRTDIEVYETAVAEDTESALRAFLLNYPGHKKETDAQRVLDSIIERSTFEAAIAAADNFIGPQHLRALSEFIRSYPKSKYVGQIIDQMWNNLRGAYPADEYTCSTSLSGLKSALPRAIAQEKHYLIAFAPRRVAGEYSWDVRTYFYELAGQECKIERIIPYITKPNGDIWSWKKSDYSEMSRPILFGPYDNQTYFWTLRDEGGFRGSSVTLDFRLVKSYTTVVGY